MFTLVHAGPKHAVPERAVPEHTVPDSQPACTSRPPLDIEQFSRRTSKKYLTVRHAKFTQENAQGEDANVIRKVVDEKSSMKGRRRA